MLDRSNVDGFGKTLKVSSQFLPFRKGSFFFVSFCFDFGACVLFDFDLVFILNVVKLEESLTKLSVRSLLASGVTFLSSIFLLVFLNWAFFLLYCRILMSFSIIDGVLVKGS